MKKKIKIPVIYAELTVVVAPTLEEALKQSKLTFESKDAGALCLHTNHCQVTLLFSEKEITPGLIAHECKHALNYFFADIGQNLDEDNDELECYFLQYIIDKVTLILQPKK